MSNEKPDLIERDAVLRMLKAITSHSSQPGWDYAEKMILSIPAATVSGTKPSIDWSHLLPAVVAIARDEDGGVYGYSVAPSLGITGWYPGDGNVRDVSAFVSYTPGTCNWRDSLVMRPGYEGE